MAETNRPYDLKHHYYMYDIGWLIDKIQAVSDELGQAIDLRTIHYADPINWDITTQYQANTVVVDNKTGVAYISSKNVPAGVLLTNTEYWNPIFNYNDAINKLMSTIAYNEQDSPTATAAHAKGSFIYSNAVLYQAIKDIATGDALKVGANMQLVVLSDSINIAIEAVLAAAREAVAAEATARINTDEELSNQIAAEATARINTDEELSNQIAAEATARADADANYTGTNRVSTVTGDDTRTAGDITDTADNVVIHGKKSILMDSDGTYTEDITGTKYINAASREITISGNDSIHIDGESSVNIRGLRTEVYAADKGDSVKGSHTMRRNNITATISGETSITAKDITISGDNINVKTTKKTLPIVFPDKTVDLYNILKSAGSGRIYLLFGDSLFYGYTPDSTVRHGWGYWLKQFLTSGGAAVLGADTITTSSIGSAFSGQKTYIDHLQKTIEDHPEYLDMPISDVIVFSGTNDITHDPNDTYNGILAFCDAIHQYWPNAFVKIGFLCSVPQKDNVVATLAQFKQAVLEKGAIYIKGTEYAAGFRSEYSSDGTHLTPDGYKALSLRLVNGAYSDILNFKQVAEVPFTIPSAPTIQLNGVALRFEATAEGVDVTLTNNIAYGSIATNNIAAGRYTLAYNSPIWYPGGIYDAYSVPISADGVTCYLTNIDATSSSKLALYVTSQQNGSCIIAGTCARLAFFR